MRPLIIGETVVDLVCERHIERFEAADLFVPHIGGAAANVAAGVVGLGGQASLGGGVGTDAWGRWVRERLRQRGVNLDHFALVADWPTPLSFVTVDPRGEPAYEFVGRGLSPVGQSPGRRIQSAVSDCDAFVFYSNSMVDADERAVTMAGRERALALGLPVIFDPNLRMSGWPSEQAAVTVAARALPGAFLVKCNAAEARALTGQGDPLAAAGAILSAGARNVVITLGAHGALLRGEGESDVDGMQVRARNATGAGDALLAALVAALCEGGFAADVLVRALAPAVRHAALSTERWGGLD